MASNAEMFPFDDVIMICEKYIVSQVKAAMLGSKACLIFLSLFKNSGWSVENKSGQEVECADKF